MISRRSFLRGAVASVPAVLIGGELAELLTPKCSIFLPPKSGWVTVTALGGEVPDRYTWSWVSGGSGLTIVNPLGESPTIMSNGRSRGLRKALRSDPARLPKSPATLD